MSATSAKELAAGEGVGAKFNCQGRFIMNNCLRRERERAETNTSERRIVRIIAQINE